MSEFFIGYFVGVIFLAGILGIYNLSPDTLVGATNAAIEQCEAELPRNQHCIVTAVPEGRE